MTRNNGMPLENNVYELVQEMLNDGRLPYRPELCRLHRKKSYFSPQRNGDVEFENVLELFVQDNVNDTDPKPSHVIFFECKDHGRNVEVGRIDEIIGRLNASFGFSMKAYVVTMKGFSSGAFQTAKNNGIGLIKIMPDDKVSFLMYHMSMSVIDKERREFPRRAREALFNENYRSTNETFYGTDDGFVFQSMKDIIGHHLESLDFSTKSA